MDIKEDNVHYSILLDIYGKILTQKQFQSLDKYYNHDLSLAEIALEENISRQAVSDNIQKGKEKLDFFEDTLKIFSKDQKRQAKIDSILKKIDKLDLNKQFEEENSQIIASIISLLNALKGE